MGEGLALQETALLGFEFRHELVKGLDVIGVAQAVDDEDVLGLRLAQEVVQLGGFVVGVDGQQDGADFGGGELEGHPVGHIGGPHGHFFVLFARRGP